MGRYGAYATARRAVEEEDPSFLQSTVLTPLAFAADVLDTPGAFVTTALSGENPFPGIFDPSRRLHGREMLETWGALDPNVEGIDAGDVGGFGVDVLASLPFNFGLTALSKTPAGKVARGLRKLPKSQLDPITGALKVGKRAMLREAGGFKKFVSPTLTAETRPLAERLAQKYGTTLAALEASDEPLARAMSIGIPGTNIEKTFDLPFGLSDVLADKFDVLGAAARRSAPGVAAYKYFGKHSAGGETLAKQLAAERFHEAAEPRRVELKKLAGDVYYGLKEGGVSSDDAQDILRRLGEQTDETIEGPWIGSLARAAMRNIPKLADESQAEWLERIGVSVTPSGRRQLAAPKLTGRGIASAISKMQNIFRAHADEATAEGFSYEVLDTPEVAQYFSRQPTDPVIAAKGGAFTSRGGRTLPTQKGGERTLRDFSADTISKAAVDPRLNRLARAGLENQLSPQSLAPPTEDQLWALTRAGLSDSDELTAQHAEAILKQPRGMADRTVVPPGPKRDFTLADRYTVQRYLGWNYDTFREVEDSMRTAKALPKLREAYDEALAASEAAMTPESTDALLQATDALTNAHAAQAIVDARMADLRKARALSRLNLQRDPALLDQFNRSIQDVDALDRPAVFGNRSPGKPYYNNAPVIDFEAKSLKDVDRFEAMKQVRKWTARGVERFDNIDAMPKDGSMVPLIDGFRDMGFGGDPQKWTNHIRNWAKEAHEAGTLSADEFANIAGSHAVMTSGVSDAQRLLAAQQAVGGIEEKVAAAVGTADEAVMQQIGVAARQQLASILAQTDIPNDGLLLLRGMAIPREIVDTATRANEWLRGGPLQDNILRSWTSFMKKHVTAPFWSFANRNLYNIMWQFGVLGARDNRFSALNPKSWIKPWQDMNALLKGKVIADAQELPIFQGRKLTAEQATNELRSLMRAHGVAEGRQTLTEFTSDTIGTPLSLMQELLPGEVALDPGPLGLKYEKEKFTGLLKGEGWKVLNPEKSAPVQAGTKMNEYFEQWGRGATMLGLMRQGFTPEMAAAKTQAAMVDYRFHSPFVRRTLKTAVPFWSWTSAMVPWTIQNIAENQGGLTAQAIKLGQRARGEGGFIPPQLEGTLAIPWGEEDDRGMQRFLTQVDLPFEVLNSIGRVNTSGVLPTLQDTARALVGQTAPWLSGAAELATGKAIYQGRNLQDLDPLLGRIALSATGDGEGTPRDTRALDFLLSKSGLGRYATTLRTALDNRGTQTKKLLRLTTGARMTDVDMDRELAKEAAKQLSDQARSLGARTFEGFNFSKDQLAKMDEDQREAAERILKLRKVMTKRAKERSREDKLRKLAEAAA